MVWDKAVLTLHNWLRSHFISFLFENIFYFWMELHSYIAFALQRRIKAVTKLLADVSEVHCKELKTTALKAHLFLFCFSFFRMMTLYMCGIAKSLPLPVSNLSNFSSWPKHLYSHQLRIICFSISRSIHSTFVAAERWWCPGSCSPGWPDLAQFGWTCLAPAHLSHQQQCSSHLPRRQHRPWINRQPMAHFFLIPVPHRGLEVSTRSGHCQPPSCQCTKGALSSEIPARKCRYCTATQLK